MSGSSPWPLRERGRDLLRRALALFLVFAWLGLVLGLAVAVTVQVFRLV